jgi:hypothetical protein
MDKFYPISSRGTATELSAQHRALQSFSIFSISFVPAVVGAFGCSAKSCEQVQAFLLQYAFQETNSLQIHAA